MATWNLTWSLTERAARHGRSVEAEHRAILEAALLAFAEHAALLQARTPPSTLDSTDLIRADRDSNYGHFPRGASIAR